MRGDVHLCSAFIGCRMARKHNLLLTCCNKEPTKGMCNALKPVREYEGGRPIFRRCRDIPNLLKTVALLITLPCM